MNHNRNQKLLSLAFLIVFGAGLGTALDRSAQVDALFSKWDTQKSPGCAVAVIEDGAIIYKKGYGMANLELGIPLSPQSVFYIGSCSKQFVTMSIALLAQQNKLSLDDEIHKFIPELPDYGTPITIKHLIYHTSGLRDYLSLLGIAGIDFGTYHEQDVLEIIARQKELNFMPGEEHMYSNSGYFLLSLIVKRASGTSQREFAKEFIFKPLGMNHTFFHDDYTRLIPNRASGYLFAGKNRYKNFISTFDCVGSGGVFSTAEDLFLWDQNFYHYKLGGQDIHNLLHTTGKLNSGKTMDYAFALVIGEYKGLKTVSHGGALGGYRSHILRFPNQNFSVICLANLSTFNPSVLTKKIADIYLADRLEQKQETEKKEDSFQAFHLTKEDLKKKVGAYMNPDTGEMVKLMVRSGYLTSVSTGYKLIPVSRTEFRVPEAQVPLRVFVEEDDQGKPNSIQIVAEGENPVIYFATTFVKPTLDQLAEYQGNYTCDELQTTFTVTLKKKRLYFSHKNAPRGALLPTLQDQFSLMNFRIRFERDQENKLNSFKLDAGRVKNLLFIKQ